MTSVRLTQSGSQDGSCRKIWRGSFLTRRTDFSPAQAVSLSQKLVRRMTVFNKILWGFSIPAFVLAVTPAYAHWGHLGDLAGHSHWVGLGAVIVAGTIAAALGKLAEGDEDGENENEIEPGDEPALQE